MVLIPGAVVVEMSADEARTHRLGYATMDDAAEDIGAKRVGDRFFVLDNLNSQWDSWEIGGRWGGMLKLLPGRQGYTAMPLRFDPEFAKILNRPPPEAWQPTPGYCDQARKKDVDWVGMATEAGAKAGAEWDLVYDWTKGTPWSSWAEVQRKFTGDTARDHYQAQPAIQAIREVQKTLPAGQRRLSIDDAWSGSREDYVAAAEAGAGVTFAVIFNGEWFGSDMLAEGTDANWNEQFHAILDQVPDEATVTVVDCHV
jgi:hypothetical protein